MWNSPGFNFVSTPPRSLSTECVSGGLLDSMAFSLPLLFGAETVTRQYLSGAQP
jgi:hypothetical protein